MEFIEKLKKKNRIQSNWQEMSTWRVDWKRLVWNWNRAGPNVAVWHKFVTMSKPKFTN